LLFPGVGDLKFPFAGTLYYIVIRRQKLREAKLISILMLGTSSVRVPSFFVVSMATPRFTLWSPQSYRTSIHYAVTIVELRKLIKRAKQCPRDQMRVRGFPAIVFLEMLVDNPAILVQQFYRYAVAGKLPSERKDLPPCFSTILRAAPRMGIASISSVGTGSSLLCFRRGYRGGLCFCHSLSRSRLAVRGGGINFVRYQQKRASSVRGAAGALVDCGTAAPSPFPTAQ